MAFSIDTYVSTLSDQIHLKSNISCVKKIHRLYNNGNIILTE